MFKGVKYKGKYLEARYGGYTYQKLNLDKNDDEFVINAIRLFNTEIGKYLKSYLDNLAAIIVSNNKAYANAIEKNEKFLLTIQSIYDQFVSFIKQNKNDFNMKDFIKHINKKLNFDEKFDSDEFDDEDNTIVEIIIE